MLIDQEEDDLSEGGTMPASPTSDPIELREARLDKRERELRAMRERIDVILDRLEGVLGIPPFGQEAKPKPALRLVPKGGDDA
jgi:hypothetical protein